MIFFLCPDFDTPSGGIRKLYRHVDVLCAAGIPATVLHHRRPFRCTWFPHGTPIAYLQETELTGGDIAVIPEIFGRRIPRMFPGIAKVILNQNAYNTFENFDLDFTGPYPYAGVLGVIAVSEDNEAYLHHAFPEANIHRIVYAIDPGLFYMEEGKKNQACFMPRKNEADAKQVIHILRARQVPLEIAAIDGLGEADTAQRLRESRFYLSFGHPEGFGLPAAEAMASGCIVVGYHGMGGSEFFRVPYAYPIEYGDIVGFAGVVEALAAEELTRQAHAASAVIHEEYSPERERQSILEAWESLLKLHGTA